MSGTLLIRTGDIVNYQADCIVNAANEALAQGGGVCGGIFQAAGADQLRRACSQFSGCATGSAVMTPAFHLNAKYIAHAVGPQWKDGRHGEPEQLRSCYQSVLRQAADKGCRTVVFPLISAGIFGYPQRGAWDMAIRTILDFFAHHPSLNMEVTITVLDPAMEAMGNAILRDRLPHPPVHCFLEDLRPGKSVSGYYLLQSPALRTSGSGKTFLSANIADRTGSVNVIFWDYSGPIRPVHEGKVVYIKGNASEFKGSLQISLDTLRLTGEEDAVELSDLVPVAPIDCDKLYGEVLALVDSITDADYQAICREFLRLHREAFLKIPAAKSVHHGFLHGLLMHTGNMVKIADQLASIYADTVDRSLLLAGTLLHDFAKREEFTFSELGLVSGYSVKGQLLGHLVMGAQEVSEIGKSLNLPQDKVMLLQHLLLSHHGKPEYGAAVIPMCAESELLSLIDMLDSRMEIYRENLAQTPMGEFSGRIFPLDGHRIYRHYDPQT